MRGTGDGRSEEADQELGRAVDRKSGRCSREVGKQLVGQAWLNRSVTLQQQSSLRAQRDVGGPASSVTTTSDVLALYGGKRNVNNSKQHRYSWSGSTLGLEAVHTAEVVGHGGNRTPFRHDEMRLQARKGAHAVRPLRTRWSTTAPR